MSSYAGSGLPQAPFQRTISTPRKVGKTGFLSMSRDGFKVGQNWVLTHSDPLLDPKTPPFTHIVGPISGDRHKTLFKSTLSGNGLFSKKALERPQTPPQIPKDRKKKHRIGTNLFEMFARTFAFFLVTRVRSPTEIVQKNMLR